MMNDVFYCVFSRLPVRSLYRFRCVCKAWRTMIDEPYLAAIHTNNLNHAPVSLLVIDQQPSSSSSLSARENVLYCSLEIKGAAAPTYYPLCNGLICYTVSSPRDEAGMPDYDDDIYLCNPIKPKDVVKLPPATPSRYYVPLLDTEFVGYVNYGAGFDSATNTYKILRFYDVVVPCEIYGYASETRLEIHTLGTRTWRKLEEITLPDSDDPFRSKPARGTPVYANGFIYWREGERDVAVFDVGNEELHWLLDLDVGLGYYPSFQLFNLRGSLALFAGVYREIWVLKGGNNEVGAWVRAYNLIGEKGFQGMTLGGMGEDGCCMLFHSGDKVISYDTKTHKWVRLDIEGTAAGHSRSRKVVCIRPSLISPSSLLL